MQLRVPETPTEEQLEAMRRMTPQERYALSLRLGAAFLAEFMADTGLSRDEALAEINRQKQAMRPHPSRSKGG